MKKKPKKLTKTQIKECLWFWFGKLYIRLRDTDENGYGYCISSWKRLYWTEWQAGHYIPNALSKAHTRDEKNVHFQSFSDNVMKHWNLLFYEDALRLKIWTEYVDYLKNTKNEIRQRKEWELIEMIKEYKRLVTIIFLKKSIKVQNEIIEYIRLKEKKMWNILYEN